VITLYVESPHQGAAESVRVWKGKADNHVRAANTMPSQNLLSLMRSATMYVMPMNNPKCTFRACDSFR